MYSPPLPPLPPSSPPKGAGVLATRNVRGCGREAGCALGVGGHPVRFSKGMPELSPAFCGRRLKLLAAGECPSRRCILW